MGGSDNTEKNMGSAVKLDLGSNPCLCLRQAIEPEPQFPNHKKGRVVFTIKGKGKD